MWGNKRLRSLLLIRRLLYSFMIFFWFNFSAYFPLSRNDIQDSHGISRGYHPFIIDAMDTSTPPTPSHNHFSESTSSRSTSRPDEINHRNKSLYLLLKQIPFDQPGIDDSDDARLGAGSSSNSSPEKMILIEGPSLHISHPPSDSPYSTPPMSRRASPSLSRRESSDSLFNTHTHNRHGDRDLRTSSSTSKSFSSSPSLASCLLSSKFMQHQLQEENSSTANANTKLWKWECTESFMREVELATPGILLARFGCCECYGRGEVLGGSGDLATRSVIYPFILEKLERQFFFS